MNAVKRLYSRFVEAEGRTVKVAGLEPSASVGDVSFSGTKYHAVKEDDGSADYDGPHWQDNSTPLDGDADDSGDRQFPVSFTRDTKMTVSAKCKIEPASLPGASFKIRGNGPGPLNIPSSDATLIGGQLTISSIECPSPFANTIDFHNPMAIIWDVILGGGAVPVSAGTSKNRAYVLLLAAGCFVPCAQTQQERKADREKPASVAPRAIGEAQQFTTGGKSYWLSLWRQEVEYQNWLVAATTETARMRELRDQARRGEELSEKEIKELEQARELQRTSVYFSLVKAADKTGKSAVVCWLCYGEREGIPPDSRWVATLVCDSRFDRPYVVVARSRGFYLNLRVYAVDVAGEIGVHPMRLDFQEPANLPGANQPILQTHKDIRSMRYLGGVDTMKVQAKAGALVIQVHHSRGDHDEPIEFEVDLKTKKWVVRAPPGVPVVDDDYMTR